MKLTVGFGEVGFGEVGFGEVGFGEVGFGEVGFGEVGFGEVGFGEVGFGEVRFGKVGGHRGVSPVSQLCKICGFAASETQCRHRLLDAVVLPVFR